MTTDVETIFIDTNILIYATNDESPFQEESIDMLNQTVGWVQRSETHHP